MLRRQAPALVFAAAALASIATSMAPTWELRATDEVESTIVASGSELGFGITAEAYGPAAGHRGGELTVFLELELDDAIGTAPSSPVRVVLTSEEDPALRDERFVTVFRGAPTTVFLDLPAWLDCEVGPCFDDFKLTVSEVGPDALISVSGTVDATLHGLDPSPEPSHEARVSVTSLGAL